LIDTQLVAFVDPDLALKHCYHPYSHLLCQLKQTCSINNNIHTMRISIFTSLVTCSSVAAFAPASTNPGISISSSSSSSSQLQAENVGRRQAMGAFGAALGTALLFPQSSNAIINPALATFKSRKQGKGQFIPGNGLHDH
jgi:hypothetical protein